MTLREHETIDVPTPRGLMRCHVLRPGAEGKFPGIVMWSEIFQVTDPIRRTAALLAGHGFVVAVPEVYHELEPPGTVLGYDTAGAGRGNDHKFTKELASYDDDAAAAIGMLQAHPACTGKIGTFGVCLGGHLAARAALHPAVQAGVCFYATDIHTGTLGLGKADDTLRRLHEIRGEMMFVWGRQDPHVSGEGRRKIYDTLTDAGVNFTWHEWNGQHAFLRDEGPRYDPVLAMRGYAMAVELFHRRLHAVEP